MRAQALRTSLSWRNWNRHGQDSAATSSAIFSWMSTRTPRIPDQTLAAPARSSLACPIVLYRTRSTAFCRRSSLAAHPRIDLLNARDETLNSGRCRRGRSTDVHLSVIGVLLGLMFLLDGRLLCDPIRVINS